MLDGSSDKDTGTANKRGGIALRLTELVFIVFIAILLARLFWLFTYGAEAPGISAVQQNIRVTAPTAVRADSKILSRFDPFYRTLPQQQQGPRALATEEVNDAPETSLQLKLFGTRVPSNDTLNAEEREALVSAVIANPQGEQRSYAIGEEILDNVSLVNVFASHVIISRGGERERLSLTEKQGVVTTNAQSQIIKRASAEPIPKRNITAARQAASSRKRSTRRPSVKEREDDPKSPRMSILGETEVQTLFNTLSMKPVMNGRSVRGWIMEPNGPGGLFRSLGLRPGDMLKEINGETLENAERLTEIYDDIRGADTIFLLIERDGSDQTVSFRYDG